MGPAIVVWLAAAVAIAGFFVRNWMPLTISTDAQSLDRYFGFNLIVLGVLFALAQFGLGWLVWRNRDRGQATSSNSGGSLRVELAITAVVALIFVSAAAYSTRMWAAIHLTPSPADAIQIDVAAKQFAWSFRYPGPDNRFGRTNLRLVNEASGNPFGIDPEDPAGKDDIVNAALRVPAGAAVQLRMRSFDVIHNLFVRELRLKQDIVPGMEPRLAFTADRIGEYEIACAELCGLGHHQMRSVLIVMPPADFAAWLKANAR